MATLAERTSDAYSAPRYGPDNWAKCADYLLSLGLSERDAEIILRSKFMRWAADQYESADAPPTVDCVMLAAKEWRRPFNGFGTLRSAAGRKYS